MAKSKVIHNTSEQGEPKPQQFVRLVFNTKPKLLRNDSMKGKDYIVVPMVMLTEGVHAGSEGAYLYTNEEIGKRVTLWNMKPVVVYHPADPSACTKEVQNSRGIGIIMNTKWDKKNKRLTAEAWLEEDRVKKVDNRIWQAIQNEEMLELSTGLFADSDEEPGEWEGEKFLGTLSNYGPDHLAILPDQVGSCSIEDGAGFYRNQEAAYVLIVENGEIVGEGLIENRITKKSGKWYVYSDDGKKELGGPYDTEGEAKKRLGQVEYFKKKDKGHKNELVASTLREQLNKAVYVPNEYRYVEDWSEEKGYCVYSNDKGGLFKQAFAVKGNEITLKGEPTLVLRKVLYEPIKNETKNLNNAKENQTMDKKKIVDSLIANKAYDEKDRDMLTALDEKVLERLEKSLQNTQASLALAPVQPKLMTEDEILQNCPTIKNKLDQLQRMEDEQKATYIEQITKNPRNAFAPEWLKTQDVPFLKNLAASVKVDEKKDEGSSDPRFLNRNYGGQGTPAQTDDLSKLPVLEPPTHQNTKKDAGK